MFENALQIFAIVAIGTTFLAAILSIFKSAELTERVEAVEKEVSRQLVSIRELHRQVHILRTTLGPSPSFSPSVSVSVSPSPLSRSVSVSPSPEPIEDMTPLTLRPLKLSGKITNKTSVKICRHCATPAMGVNQAYCEKCGAPLSPLG